MADPKKKETTEGTPPQAAPVETAAVADKPADAPAPEKAPVPIEVASDKNGIQIALMGDHVELRLSQYIAEHIGQYRACKSVIIRFKNGHTPDITAYHGEIN